MKNFWRAYVWVLPASLLLAILSGLVRLSLAQGNPGQNESVANLNLTAHYTAEAKVQTKDRTCQDQITLTYTGAARYKLMPYKAGPGNFDLTTLTTSPQPGVKSERTGGFTIGVQGGGNCVEKSGVRSTWTYSARYIAAPPNEFPSIGVQLRRGQYGIGYEFPDAVITGQGQMTAPGGPSTLRPGGSSLKQRPQGQTSAPGGASIPLNYFSSGPAMRVLINMRAHSIQKLSDALEGTFKPYSKQFSSSNSVSNTVDYPADSAGQTGAGSLNVSYSLSVGVEEAKADPGGPYTAVRGQPLKLDGSRSKGTGLAYKWTITPKGCPANAGSASDGHKDGAQATVVLLCEANITLTVSDGKSTDTKSTAAVVQARNWKTQFAVSPVEAPLPRGGNRVPLRSSRDRGLQGGENRCALDPFNETASDEVLHPTVNADGPWEKTAYELEQVQDPGGPFDQWWFVSDYKLQIQRQAWINPYILQGGPPPAAGIEPFYHANKRLGTDVDGYIAAVRAHEGITNGKGVLGHSGLIQKALPKNDPGPKVEDKFNKSQGDVKKAADSEIRKAEIALCKATNDPLPVIWTGKLAFAKDDTGIYSFLPYTVGGAGYEQPADCAKLFQTPP